MDNLSRIASLFKERGMGFYSTTLVVLRMVEDNVPEQEILIGLLEDESFDKEKLQEWISSFWQRHNGSENANHNIKNELRNEYCKIINDKLKDRGIYIDYLSGELADFVVKDVDAMDEICTLLDKEECNEKVIDRWKYSYLRRKEKQNPVFGKKGKNKLWITFDDSVAGTLKWHMVGTDKFKSIDFMSIEANFCTNRLPKSLTEEDINETLDSMLWFERYSVRSSLDYLSHSDLAEYDEIVVWIDMTANSLLILYMICTYIKNDIFVSIINDTGKFQNLDLGGPDPNYSEILGPVYRLTEEMRERFTIIWKEALNHQNEYKITDGEWGIKYVPHTYIDDRLMYHLSNRYKRFYDVAFSAHRENLHESFFPYEVYEDALCKLILDGNVLVKTKDMKRYMELNVEKLGDLLGKTRPQKLQVRLP